MGAQETARSEMRKQKIRIMEETLWPQAIHGQACSSARPASEPWHPAIGSHPGFIGRQPDIDDKTAEVVCVPEAAGGELDAGMRGR